MENKTQAVAFVKMLTGKCAGVQRMIEEDSFSIGRTRRNHLTIPDDKYISRNHCAILKKGSSLFLEDLQSQNGTYLNGSRITGTVEFKLPAYLNVGRTRIAVLPAAADNEQIAALEESTFSTEGSILIPPSNFFKERTEAFLVVDTVGSTRIVKDSSIQLSKAISVMGQLLDKALRREEESFLKCTGDGFFACFSSAYTALSAAVKLVPRLSRKLDIQFKTSFGLHWGCSRLNSGGDRIGKDVHAVFALEHLRHKVPALTTELESSGSRVCILMTEKFLLRLDKPLRRQTQALGYYPLKGLDQQERIFRWAGDQDAE